MAKDDSLKVYIDGKDYDIDEFEIGELEWLEEELGSLDDLALRSMKAAVRFVYLIKHRDDPEFTLDDARKLKLNVFDEPEAPSTNGKGKAGRPTKRSAPAGSGATS